MTTTTTTTTTTAAAGLFDALTTDELRALSDALISRRDGGSCRFSANRMAAMLGNIEGADDAYHAYRDIAREIGILHSQACDLYCDRMNYTGPAR